MKSRLERKISRHAFGETSPREASAVESLVARDADSAELLSTYQAIRNEMALLNEVPPDQFSKERLRDAILGQGLKPLPVQDSSVWNWAWMPASAFALVFGWLAIHQIQRGRENVLMPSGSAVVAQSSDHSKLELRFQPHPNVSPKESVVSRRDKPSSAPKTFAMISNPKKREVGDRNEIQKFTSTANRVVAMLSPSNLVEEPKIHSSSSENQTSNEGAAKLASSNGPMVMINPEKDTDSGAQKATEVDSASNVVVGG